MSEYFKDEFKKDIYNNTHSIPSLSLRYPFSSLLLLSSAAASLHPAAPPENQPLRPWTLPDDHGFTNRTKNAITIVLASMGVGTCSASIPEELSEVEAQQWR
jgi:hypothetical protein